MATTGPKLTIPFLVGASKIVGQGDQPESWILYSLADVSAQPSWVDASRLVRGFETDRGRDSALSEIDAGTGAVELDNRTRTFDPVINTNIRPRNRWWIREQFTGETKDIIKGYAERYDQRWVPPNDAATIVKIADELKVLASDSLPVTNPPRDNYSDVVLFDEPAAYWRMNDPSSNFGQTATRGSNLIVPGSSASGSTTPGFIVGEDDGAAIFGATAVMATGAVDEMGGDYTDVGGLAEFALETWFYTTSPSPAGGDFLITGPISGGAGTYQYALSITAAQITIAVRNSALTVFSVTSAAIAADTVYHIVGTVEGGSLRLYLNGVSVGTPVAFTPPFRFPVDAGSAFQIGDSAGAMTQSGHDEVAVYRHGLTAARVLAHYQAGALDGFDQQNSGTRIAAVLAASTSSATTAIQTGARSITPKRMTGQSPLSAIRDAVSVDNVDAMFFAAADGTLTFLADGHRSASPYNTVQATFDDDGTDLPYHDLELDFSETFLFNYWTVTRDLGETQTSFDQTSIDRYDKQPQSLTGLPMISDANAATVAAALLAKYKDPFTRITKLELSTASSAVTEAVFRLDLGARIRVFRRPPGGGAAIDQTLFVQKISINASPTPPWTITLGVSPL